MLGHVRLWPLEGELAPLYGEIFKDLRRRGSVLSQVDMLLAALAKQMDVTLATTDRDFAALPDVRTVYWVQTEDEK